MCAHHNINLFNLTDWNHLLTICHTCLVPLRKSCPLNCGSQARFSIPKSNLLVSQVNGFCMYRSLGNDFFLFSWWLGVWWNDWLCLTVKLHFEDASKYLSCLDSKLWFVSWEIWHTCFVWSSFSEHHNKHLEFIAGLFWSTNLLLLYRTAVM